MHICAVIQTLLLSALYRIQVPLQERIGDRAELPDLNGHAAIRIKACL